MNEKEVIEDITEINVHAVTNKGKRTIKFYDFINLQDPTITFITNDERLPRREFNLNIKYSNCKIEIK